MSTAFVPFSAQSISNGPAKNGFQQLKATPVSSAVPMVAKESSVAVPPAAAAMVPHQHAAPQVTLQREGDKVTGIRVDCGCGQVMLLDCVY